MCTCTVCLAGRVTFFDTIFLKRDFHFYSQNDKVELTVKLDDSSQGRLCIVSEGERVETGLGMILEICALLNGKTFKRGTDSSV